MRNSIRTLLEMEKIDLQIERLRRDLGYYPAKIRELQQGIDSQTAAFAATESSLEEYRMERKMQEGELSLEEDRLRKLKGRIMEVKTNAEYQALMREIEHVKRSNSQKEEEILKLIERFEGEEKTLAAAKESVAKMQSEIEQLKIEEAQKRSAREAEISTLAAERDQIGAAVPAPLLSKYRSLKQRRSGTVLAAVDHYVCQACNMNLPPQVCNEVLEEKSIYNCPNCYRILYVKDWFQEAN